MRSIRHCPLAGVMVERDIPVCQRAALHYTQEFGWKLFPARMEDGKKFSWLSAEFAPGHENWGMTNDLEQLRKNFDNPRWRNKCGVGLPTGPENGVFICEADTIAGHGVDGIKALRALEKQHGKLPKTLMAKSPSGSIHHYFKHPGGDIRLKSMSIAAGVDIKADGGMVVAPPSVRTDGAYTWTNNAPIAEAPAWLIDLIRDSGGNGYDINDPFANLREPLTEAEIIAGCDAIRDHLPNNDDDWDDWNTNGLKIFHVAPDGRGFSAFDEYSQRSHKYDAKLTTERWAAYFKSPPTHVSNGSFIYLANQSNPNWRGQVKQEAPKAELNYITGEALELLPLEPVQWIVDGFIMRDVLNGMFGDGGTGKDYLLLQLTIAMATNGKWLGREVTPGKVLYFNVEDRVPRIRWRQHQITQYLQTKCADYPDRLRVVPMVGKNTIIATFNSKSGLVEPTSVLTSITSLIGDYRPDLVIMGNRVNIFGVNQNEDSQARQCIELLNALSLDYATTLIMPGHVSVRSMGDDSGTSGSGSSGSVQWSNGPRQRLLLSKAKKDKDTEDDTYKRTLTVLKSNDAPSDQTIELHWSQSHSLYVADDENVTTKILRTPMKPGETEEQTQARQRREFETEVEDECMRCVSKALAMGIRMSPQPRANNYPPTLFARHTQFSECKYRGDKGFRLLNAAMGRLFMRGKIKAQPYGSPSAGTKEIVIND